MGGAMGAMGGGFGGMPQMQTGPVCLIVSGLPTQPDSTGMTVGCDQLFSLFGFYGDIVKVKIMFNKRDTVRSA